MAMETPEQRRLRRIDLWTGMGLTVFAVAMIAVTLITIPLADSFGGVRNVWYVSPGLLPLLIAGGMLVLSALLVMKSVRELGMDGVKETLRLPEAGISPRGLRLWMILGGICCYVYVLVPRVDFVIATALFLLPFIYAFQLDREASVLRNLVAVIAAGSAIAIASAILSDGVHDAVVDGIGVVSIIAIAWVNRAALVRRDLPTRHWRTGLIVALVAPLFLALAFRYGLLVPMPHEGTLLTAIDMARYSLLR